MTMSTAHKFDSIEHRRRHEAERLDELESAIWPNAMAGNLDAIDRCLAIMERRARLLGLDAPTRFTIELWVLNSIDAEVERLSRELDNET
jgi:hypothetical protein